MAIIKRGVKEEYFKDIISGKKKYELRLGDLKVELGDTLVLEEESDAGGHTGRKIERKVTNIHRLRIDELFWTEEQIKEKGLQIISFD